MKLYILSLFLIILLAGLTCAEELELRPESFEGVYLTGEPQLKFKGFQDVSINWASNSDLPMEGEKIYLDFEYRPVMDIETTDNIVIVRYLISPEGEIYRYGYDYLPKGPYLYGETYRPVGRNYYRLNMPGFWKLRYLFLEEEQLNAINDSNEMLGQKTFKTETIHVLSVYEKDSMSTANKALWVSIIGIFIAFLLGTGIPFFMEKIKFTPQIRVKYGHSIISMGHGSSLHAITIEVINFGRVAVTLSSWGIKIKNSIDALHILKNPIMPFSLPHELLPGRNFQIHLEYDKLKKEFKEKEPAYIFFKDQTGKEYRSDIIPGFFKKKRKKFLFLRNIFK